MSKRAFTPHRTDGNHAEIVQALRKMGASVLDIHDIGHGAPDLLVGYLATARCAGRTARMSGSA